MNLRRCVPMSPQSHRGPTATEPEFSTQEAQQIVGRKSVVLGREVEPAGGRMLFSDNPHALPSATVQKRWAPFWIQAMT